MGQMRETRVLHPSGALWLPDLSALLVADLHLGYGLAQRRRGQLGPIADTKTAEKLHAVLEDCKPKSLILLGDAVHAPNPSQIEKNWIEECFTRWLRQTSIVFVRGNHDRKIARDFGFDVVEQWRALCWIAVHGDGIIPQPRPFETVVMGHLHPGLGIEDAAGVRQKVPVFLEGPQVLVLPAFSPFAAGLDVARRFPESLRLFGNRDQFTATAATGRRVVELGLVTRLRSMAAGSRPSDFRQTR